jgi:hypothetical protein
MGTLYNAEATDRVAAVYRSKGGSDDPGIGRKMPQGKIGPPVLLG